MVREEERTDSNGTGRFRVTHDEENGLFRSQTGVTMSPEMFEKLYLSPKVPHAGDFNKRFANPTALGFFGLVVTTCTFAIILMGWGGAKGFAPVLGIFLFVGPVLLLVAMVFEWIMGNFFPMMTMGMFAVFWLSFGVLQMPTLQLGDAAAPEYNAVLGVYLIVWGFAFFTFFVFACKINVVFAAIFLLVSTTCFVLSGMYWKISTGDMVAAGHLQTAGGAMLFVVALLGWYATFIIMAGEMRLPVNLPVGDLTHFWPRSDVELAATEHRD
ncbi:GPR1/FUN34/yaaH family-domain-containing protein [Podospora appendiculata]|uniref:GPR1/FUN34/yaaH family-domain-containing protein n=1 Tax=Podospora appendiculata TaxID=314037 RepID=A0AAE1CIJ9_9PEZI|nr:GPR1/FUN34/yaaH family-domain-containing protein [Podospora appendiculata]